MKATRLALPDKNSNVHEKNILKSCPGPSLEGNCFDLWRNMQLSDCPSRAKCFWSTGATIKLDIEPPIILQMIQTIEESKE